jgi:hypothetical protein
MDEELKDLIKDLLTTAGWDENDDIDSMLEDLGM